MVIAIKDQGRPQIPVQLFCREEAEVINSVNRAGPKDF